MSVATYSISDVAAERAIRDLDRQMESFRKDCYTKEQTDKLLEKKVDQERGKGLSSNDYSDAEKSKLNGIEPEAQKNVRPAVVTLEASCPTLEGGAAGIISFSISSSSETEGRNMLGIVGFSTGSSAVAVTGVAFGNNGVVMSVVNITDVSAGGAGAYVGVLYG